MDLQALKAAFNASTQGEWYEDESEHRVILPNGPDVLNWDDHNRSANAHFIALAHNLMPDLLMAIEQLAYYKEIAKATKVDSNADLINQRDELAALLAQAIMLLGDIWPSQPVKPALERRYEEFLKSVSKPAKRHSTSFPKDGNRG